MSTLSARHQWIVRKDDGVVCTCDPVNPKHAAGYRCVSEEEMAKNLVDHPEFRGSREKLRALTYLERFKP